MFSIMAYIVFGMLAGWIASLLVRRDMHPGGLISSILFASLILWIVTAAQNHGQSKAQHQTLNEGGRR